jgi:hypothetical protein
MATWRGFSFIAMVDFQRIFTMQQGFVRSLTMTKQDKQDMLFQCSFIKTIFITIDISSGKLT